MNQRKIFKYESVILVEETIKKYGYNPNDLGNTSSKFVLAICRVCGLSHNIRKGFYIKSGSACHKDCKIKEMKQQKSPFSDPEVRNKAKKSNIARYGTEYASQNKDIAKKISYNKSSEASKEKTKQTNLAKYGVENVFQSEDIKKKIRKTNINKYGVDHPLKNEDIKINRKKTNLEKYGVENIFSSNKFKEDSKATNLIKYGFKHHNQNKNIKEISKKSFEQTVTEDKNGNYKLINILRNEDFWKMLSEGQKTLKEVCANFNLEYKSVTSRLLDKEFCDKYYSLYSFPKQQKQKIIYGLIQNFGINCSLNDRSIIYPLELDIYMPTKKIAIEFNGSYWHSESRLSSKEARMKHRIKLNLCREKGIRLVQIFENNWDNRKEQILNYLMTLLGMNAINIGARECSLSYDSCRSFIDDNHIQGYGNGTIKYFNLTYNGQIVSSMTASKHHRQNIIGNPIVLNRLCFKHNYNIQGGSSKLFKSFKSWAKENKYDRIISWSDNCWTEGNIYRVLGFNLIKEYDPDYFYWSIKDRKYLSKQSQQKRHVDCPSDKTEREWAIERGLYRIWDCGKKLWEIIL